MQLTSAHTHTRTNCACESHSLEEPAADVDGAKKERSPLIEPRPPALKGVWPLIYLLADGRCSYNTAWPLIQGGAALVPKVLGRLQPPQPPPPPPFPASYATGLLAANAGRLYTSTGHTYTVAGTLTPRRYYVRVVRW